MWAQALCFHDVNASVRRVISQEQLAGSSSNVVQSFAWTQ